MSKRQRDHPRAALLLNILLLCLGGCMAIVRSARFAAEGCVTGNPSKLWLVYRKMLLRMGVSRVWVKFWWASINTFALCKCSFQLWHCVVIIPRPLIMASVNFSSL